MSLFGGAKKTMAEAPKSAQGIRVQSSAYGVVVPILFGRTRVTGNVLWYGNFIAIPHVQTQSTGGGGSGGGGSAPSSTTYTYTTGMLLGLTEGPIASFHKMWINKSRYLDRLDPVLTQVTEALQTNGSGQATVAHAASFYQDGGLRAEVSDQETGGD